MALCLSRVSKNDLFWHQIWKNTDEKKFDFWTKSMELPLRKLSIFLAFLKSLIFWSKKYLFISRWKKKFYLDKNHRLSPQENVDFFGLFNSLIFWSKNHSFFPQDIKELSFLTWFLQKNTKGKSSIFGQKQWTNLSWKCWFLALFQNFNFSGLKSTSFLPWISKNDLFWLDFFKNTDRKRFDFFLPERWTIPLGKLLFFGPFNTSIFWSKTHSVLSRISKNHLLWHSFCKKQW